jgi:hypothetical protein
MPAAILSHFTFWKDLTKLSPGDAAETAWWLNWYKQNRAAITGFTYEDTKADPIDGKSWLALQPWNGTGGYLFVFSQASGGTQAIALQGVSPTTQYQLTDVRTGQIVGAFSGASLSQGLSLTLPAYAAQVIAVTPG